ncbi:NAD(P)-dependent glycerol-3-phosphate dehydrogenase [Mariprofundus sp. EBB-1]|uniref:NAD(P)H-dependent glycerol-3-phosphate dehydrogenase n=1 Tax=Mariprofundus sp. EBB-1 TaxID=2650971 RepID=UPI000EF215A4|nr:NAD(P)H-dependent glycerol-3-phosphate dehydrogenase [Mariprofundus sp. EBB-1]RLL54791.1 NAD(P)-dependent glycerol-3-phosphate dehydrogenase [Mariprofundus sp. EBB-1]
MRGEHVCVLGAGSWGTALALVLARSGKRQVRLYTREQDQVTQINQTRENSDYLPGISLPDNIQLTSSLETAIADIDACIYALPCIAVDDYLPQLADGNYPVIAACKGLHPDHMTRNDEMLAQYIDRSRIAILSGPSFAMEVAQNQPTAITMAAETLALAQQAATFFDDTNFRVYLSDDVIGVAMGGALKNVIAIAAGMADGLGFGHNAVAAAVTRGLAEIARLTEACGGRTETLMGLSGLGDLVLTCTGSLSRNRRFGMAIATGKTIDEAKIEIGQVVEGVRTAQAVALMAKKFGVELPLMQSVNQILDGKLDIQLALAQLLSRPERPE